MTAQIYERLIIAGEEVQIPPTLYLPKKHPDVVEVSPVETQLWSLEAILQTSACWRRYLGTWEIRDGQLYLINLIGNYRLRDDTAIFAEWFSGILKIPTEELRQPEHIKGGELHEGYIHVQIARGNVV